MQIISSSPKETIEIGRVIAGFLRPQDIICLSGDLGCGKTILAKGIAAGLKIKAFDVTSSSFVIIRAHLNGKIPFYHFDLYRLKDMRDISSLGYEEYLYGEGVSVIEWPQNLGCLAPKECLRVELIHRDEFTRRIKFSAQGKRYKLLLRNIHENIGH
ncbi:MAG: tRNA (adenosine(37)-N6)-threonylcarbamoyltransferase complex ATPase subunit type 1 TsaE [Candidatus Omnitrophica bacterium]|jgi:tRNA threonylcarbamoyladenosine biosynthesis protein TsaE|nr:tRNA (adenosine(37)-N6)-threonylcarbamoyltransferase complex ATPase subunit type 1 TsaE [Candidatus Omnitrophota bacterium]MDD3987743.1 tRNA (adenosine(37)-N6)-threonylcarbamoyltransferase complex ATPase subunit type 1 TsaE [Candidatus Omnitrophota bacterium]MDD4982178.1 tRNA (adenosine(37)-N6)-threonylcarbamoyltransferase complex ATPase subunit type 1 TsaE [Candidatus Omnitrophota bacterium]MDD5664951.1 tRNA (adenosine(37)-N6)-threonylcarbamoyltransferase complex ATPase subunit type 1 TsaE [